MNNVLLISNGYVPFGLKIACKQIKQNMED